jgi:hypothetical protein
MGLRTRFFLAKSRGLGQTLRTLLVANRHPGGYQPVGNFPETLRPIISLGLALLVVYSVFKVIKKDFIKNIKKIL